MTTTDPSARTLDYMRITGPGVDALEHRREHNNNTPVTAEKLQASIDKVKPDIFASLKALAAGAVQLVKK